MKKIFLFLLSICFIIPNIVHATSSSSGVCYWKNNSSCSGYQDSSVSTDDVVYFSHRMVSNCNNQRYSSPAYTDTSNRVTCSNGNTQPQAVLVKSGCPSIGTVCNNGEVSYCSIIIKYDCSKTSSGADYKTTTTTTSKRTTRSTTRRTTTKSTTTKITTTVAKSNTNLKSLYLSTGDITFKSDVYEYSIEVKSDVNSINVTAIPEDGNSKVSVTGNSDIKNGSVIKIVVTGKDNSTSTYTVKVNKEVYVMSNNAKLKYLNVESNNINFSNTTHDYTIFIDREVYQLNISYETEDKKASVSIDGNENLVNGSKVVVTVKAEDGTENKFTINVNVKKKSNFIKYLFIIILVLAILAGAYYLYMKFIQSKKGEKYEYE